MPITPSSKASRHRASVRSSNVPRVLGPTALMSAFSSPCQRSLSSSNTRWTWSASVVSATNPSASGLPHSVRSFAAPSSTSFVRPTTATRAPSSARQRAAANPIPRPPPTTTAVASFSPRSMARGFLGAGPIRRALLGERDRAFLGIVGGEDRNDVFELLLPHLVFTPIRRLGHDLLGGRYRHRPVGGDPLRECDRPGQRFAWLGHHVDEAPRLTLLSGKAVTGQREFERLLKWNALLQAQQPTARGHQAALDLGNAELRATRCHHQVGSQHDLGAAGQCVTLHSGDQRFARRAFGEADAPAR